MSRFNLSSLIFCFFAQMQKDLNEKRLCKTSILRHFECCHVASKSSSFQDSSTIKCTGVMKTDRVRSCCSKTGEENTIKLLKYISQSRTIFTSSEYYVTWTRSENAALFFQKIIRYIVQIIFELLYILQNWSFSPNCAIMRSDAARGQLCEIASAHNIRIPVYSVNKPFCKSVEAEIRAKIFKRTRLEFETTPESNFTRFFFIRTTRLKFAQKLRTS